MSVVSALALPVRDGVEDDVARFYAEAGVFELSRRSGGFLGGRLLRPVERGGPMLVIAEWESPADYRRWLDSPARAGLAEGLEPYLAAEVSEGTVYEEA